MTSLRRSTAALLLTLQALTFFGCRKKEVIPPDVVARVGERFLTLAGFKRYLERNAGTDLSQLTQEVSSAMLDQYIEEILISEYAGSHSIEVPAEQIAAEVRREAGVTVVEKRDEMRRQKLIAEISAQLPDPTEKELRDYYEQHMPEFKSEEEVRVKQILVSDEKLAGEIARKLSRGESFE
ncbi:MAG TPA: peptidyl-prolyl cis-trans isomerase, partial [Thermoanaerobaculia bacterium]|nr:peptidyl-prolyl cis-trans isomerase [Thermoanaerobaculia bacterium]